MKFYIPASFGQKYHPISIQCINKWVYFLTMTGEIISFDLLNCDDKSAFRRISRAFINYWKIKLVFIEWFYILSEICLKFVWVVKLIEDNSTVFDKMSILRIVSIEYDIFGSALFICIYCLHTR